MQFIRLFFICILFTSIFVGKNLYAYDFGPISVRGFALVTVSRSSNQCPDCQAKKNEDRQRIWADEIDSTKKFGPKTTLFSLFQPYLELRPYRLGQGFSVSAMLSQRWRDGMIDIPGIWYERNVTLAHEYYGSVQYGAYPTRGWGIADYPYGSFVGLADAWGSSGSGYGLLTNAIRYTLPPIGVLKGDLRLEVTHDPGKSGYVQDQQFWEYYAQFVSGKFVLDFIHQNAKNGKPSSWTHGAFLGLTDEAKYKHEYNKPDSPLPTNEQKIWLLMSRYGLGKYEMMGGLRSNYWSGARAAIVGKADNGDYLWNNMFNVHWDGTLNGVDNPGYPAKSQDYMLGGRYFYAHNIIFAAGAVHLGKAETQNPVERGQSNTATFMNIGVSYIGLYEGLMLSAGISRAEFKKKGLAPLSMPGHSAFSGVDSRVNTTGGAFGITGTYNF